MKLDIRIDNNIVYLRAKSLKMLGVKFDPILTYNQHAKYVKNRMEAKNNVLKTLAGTSWGKDKETLEQTYEGNKQTYC